MGIFVGSHLRTKDRVSRLEVKSQFIESKGELLDETHDAVLKLEGSVKLLESDLRNSSEAFSRTMQANAASLDEINSTLTEITSEFKR
jgi:uncharacterized protein YoxC